MQAPGHVGVLGGVVERLVQRHLVEGHLRLAGTGHVLELDGLMPEMQARQLVHAVAVPAAVEHVRQEHGVVQGRDRDPVAGQHQLVVLEVLADLEDTRVLEQRLERGQRGIERDLPGRRGGSFQVEAAQVETAGARGRAMAERDIAGLARRERERHPNQVGAERVERGGLGVDRDASLLGRGHDPGLERRQVLDQLVVRLAGLGRRRGAGCRGGLAEEVGEARDHRVETVLLEEGA